MAIDIKNINLDFILKRPIKQKILIVAVLNVVIAGLIYQFLLSPKLTVIKDLRGKLNALNVQVGENRKVAADIPKYEKEKKDLETEFELALKQLPEKKDIDGLLGSISAAAKQSGLKILLFQPQGMTPRGFYADVPVTMEVEGTYESLYSFCDKISKLPRIVNIEGINVSVAEKAVSLSPKIKGKFTALTFMFISDQDEFMGKEAEKRAKEMGKGPKPPSPPKLPGK